MRFQDPTAWIGSIHSKGGRVRLPGFGLLMRFLGG